MKGPTQQSIVRMRRTVSALNVRSRPKCHHGPPSDDVVRLRFSRDSAWLWIGGEAAPMECHSERIHQPGAVQPDPVALARKLAARLRKRLVIVEE